MTLPATVAVDVGGTKIRAGSVIDGELAHVRSVPTPATAGAQAVLDTIAEATAAVIADTSGSRGAEFAWRIGIGAAGVIDPAAGTVVSATDSLPGWAGTDLVTELSARSGLPVRVVNDVHAHALGEAAAGASRGTRNSLLVAAGTGIGGGFITDGHLLTGRNSAAGHVGHVPSAAASWAGLPMRRHRPCRGHRLGAGHHSSTYRRLVRVHPTSSTCAAPDRHGDTPIPSDNTRELAAAASAGDALAVRAFDIGARALGSALGGISNILSPEVIVVGGGLAEMDETWWDASARRSPRSSSPPPREPSL